MTNDKRHTAANRKRWTPPRGIRLFDLPNRPESPKAVQWRVAGKRKTKTFATAEQQLEFAKDLAGAAQEHGLAAFQLDPAEAREWRAFRARLGPDVGLDAVLACWERYGRERQRVTVQAAVAAYLKAKEAEGISAPTLAHYRPVFDRLNATFGLADVGSVRREDLAGWLAGLKMEPWSRRSHLTRVRGLFRWLRVSRQIAEDPCDGLRPVKIVQKEVKLITPEQGAKLFAANAAVSRELCGRLALEAFAGIRFESVATFQADDIKRDMRGILLPAERIKTRKRRFIQNLPANLWGWLDWSKPESWVMTKRQYLEAKSLSFVRAGVPHPRNVLRKCFATYHLAANANAGHTAAVLCHTSLTKLLNDYNGIASSETSKRWFKIVPPKI